MLAICSYPLEILGAKEIFDVLENHHYTLIRRNGKWIVARSFVDMLNKLLEIHYHLRGENIDLIRQIGISSHEIKTPLTSMKGYTQILLKGQLG